MKLIRHWARLGLTLTSHHACCGLLATSFGVPLGLLFDLLIGAVPQCDFHSLATLGKAVDSNSERCVCVCAGAWRVALWRVLGASEV